MRRILRLTAICTLFLFVPTCVAQEKTYGARTLDEWVVLAEHDLELETRMRAVTAIAALGEHENQERAAKVLREIVARETSDSMLTLAYQSILQFGELSTETIVHALHSTSNADQLRILKILARHPTESYAMAPELSKAITPKLVELFAQHVVPPADSPEQPMTVDDLRNKMMELARSGRPREEIQQEFNRLSQLRSGTMTSTGVSEIRFIRSEAAVALMHVLRAHPTPEFAGMTLRKFEFAEKSDDVELACFALQAIGTLGESARPAVSLLIDNLDVNDWRGNNGSVFVDPRGREIRGGFGGFRDPTTAERFPSRAFSSRSGATRSIIRSRAIAAAIAIRELGPIAIDAKGKLEELVAQENSPSTFRSALTAVQRSTDGAANGERDE